MRYLLPVLSAVLALSIGTTSKAATTHTNKVTLYKKSYYHSNGYISAIWKNARRTVYHPDMKVRHMWQAALRFLTTQRERAWKALHPAPRIPTGFVTAFTCIHHYEGAWNANTGNGYYGGLQMDMGFQSTYGSDFMAKWGTADNWPPWAQIQAAIRAHASRGFGPWPNTARACGLL